MAKRPAGRPTRGRRCVIYALLDGSGVRYVGKTVQPRARLRQHLNPGIFDNSERARWIRGASGRIWMVVLERCWECDWEAREREWISRLSNSCRLTNGTSGGDGVPVGGARSGYRWTPLQRARIMIKSNRRRAKKLGLSTRNCDAQLARLEFILHIASQSLGSNSLAKEYMNERLSESNPTVFGHYRWSPP